MIEKNSMKILQDILLYKYHSDKFEFMTDPQ